jgi:hypothetical protein
VRGEWRVADGSGVLRHVRHSLFASLPTCPLPIRNPCVSSPRRVDARSTLGARWELAERRKALGCRRAPAAGPPAGYLPSLPNSGLPAFGTLGRPKSDKYRRHWHWTKPFVSFRWRSTTLAATSVRARAGAARTPRAVAPGDLARGRYNLPPMAAPTHDGETFGRSASATTADGHSRGRCSPLQPACRR